MYEYDTLNEAINSEESLKKDCNEANYFCNVTRDGNVVSHYISYGCDVNPPNSNDGCNYIEEITKLEDLGFICEEDKEA